MLTHLQVQNFKAWRNTQAIRLAPLTVFFGSNSSGKSSINQLLMMLKQTVQSPDRRMALHLGDKKTVIELGTFWDVIHAHENNERIAFELEWQMPSEMNLGKSIKFSSEIGLAGGERQDLVVYQLSYQMEPSKLKVEMKREDKNLNQDKYSLTISPSHLVPAKSAFLSHPIHFYGFPSEVTVQYENADFVHELTLALEQVLQDIYYLGTLREPPQRYYIKSGENPESVGWRGERAVEVILAAQKQWIRAGSQT